MNETGPGPGLSLILGGARSGKSAHAEALCESLSARPVYLATATLAGDDPEMAGRVAAHRARRGGHWRTVEAPLELAAALEAEAAPGRALLVDCLTLWLSNLMLAGRDVPAAGETLAGALGRARLRCPVVLVSSEVGLGIVPGNRLARAFRDHAGRLHQSLAARADRVVLVVAGLPLTVKGG